MSSKLIFSSLLGALIFGTSTPITVAADIGQVRTNLYTYSRKVAADEVLITRNGRAIFQYSSEQITPRFDAMEMSKPFISFAVMFLIQEGKIPGLDIPLKNFHPLPKQQQATFRSLLNSSDPDDCALVISLIKKISGYNFEEYLLCKLFLPLEIYSVTWHDSSDSYPHLHITSDDLAKVGSLIINRGLWGCKQVISTKNLEAMFLPNECTPFNAFYWHLEFYDLACWWDDALLKFYGDEGVPEWILYRLKQLQGRVIHFSGNCYGGYSLEFMHDELISIFGSHDAAEQFISTIDALNLPLGRFQPGKIKSISALGSGGQQLLILPQPHLVAVRQRHLPPETSYQWEYLQFVKLLEELSYGFENIED